MNNELIIYTDSSHHRKLGSWSVFLKFNNESHLVSGICPEYVTTAAQGETYAVFKAVEFARKLFPEIKAVKIHSDCQGLCFVLKRNARPQKHPVNRMLQQAILRDLIDSNYSWEVVFVRSHQQVDTEESYYNGLVDINARRIRRKNKHLQDRDRAVKSFNSFVRLMSQTGVTSYYFFKLLEWSFSRKIGFEQNTVEAIV